jgi:hypothetical protein
MDECNWDTNNRRFLVMNTINKNVFQIDYEFAYGNSNYLKSNCSVSKMYYFYHINNMVLKPITIVTNNVITRNLEKDTTHNY